MNFLKTVVIIILYVYVHYVLTYKKNKIKLSFETLRSFFNLIKLIITITNVCPT